MYMNRRKYAAETLYVTTESEKFLSADEKLSRKLSVFTDEQSVFDNQSSYVNGYTSTHKVVGRPTLPQVNFIVHAKQFLSCYIAYILMILIQMTPCIKVYCLIV